MNETQLIRRTLLTLLLVLMGSVVPGLSASGQPSKGSTALGKRIYREGILSNGTPVQAIVNNDVPIQGKIARCAQCHRNSGFGSDEPGKIVPAITGPRLFAARTHDRGEEIRSLFQEPQTHVESTRVRIPKNRPPYTPDSLIESLRTGHDFAGRLYGPLKPRYDFNATDARHLIAYIKTLGANHEPGIDEHTIHFATIVTDDVPEDEQRAYLKTIETFVATRNRETARYQVRPGISPNYKNDLLKSYRRWKVHVWRLEGGREMYPLQLVDYYEKTPVFAILGGLSGGDWRPIHRFCDNREIPCIFPQTPFPQTQANGGYTIYFDQGIFGEATALRRDLVQKRESGIDVPVEIDVIYRQRSLGRAFAACLQRELEGLDVSVDAVQMSEKAASENTVIDTPRAKKYQLLCVPASDVPLAVQHSSKQPPVQMLLSSSVMGVESCNLVASRTGACVLVPYELPSATLPRTYRLRQWFKSRRVELTHPTLQMKTYFLLSVTSHAFGHMVERHSRDYLIERIEHETENALNPGVYTQLSLGPGQRFAAAGCDVISPAN